MGSNTKTITASFENIDLAELACKNIKEKYKNINAISIRYKNIPYDKSDYLYGETNNNNLDEKSENILKNSLALGSTVNGGIAPMGTVFVGQNLNTSNFNNSNNDIEIQNSLESKVIIKTKSDTDAKNISHTLRGLGGQNITIS